MSININLKLFLLLGIIIISLLFTNSVFAEDASSSASPTSSATPISSPSSTPSTSPTPTESPTPSPTSASGSTTSSPTPTAKPKDNKVLGAATTLGATGREIDFIKWVLIATVFLASLFIGIKALRSNAKE